MALWILAPAPTVTTMVNTITKASPAEVMVAEAIMIMAAVATATTNFYFAQRKTEKVIASRDFDLNL